MSKFLTKILSRLLIKLKCFIPPFAVFVNIYSSDLFRGFLGIPLPAKQVILRDVVTHTVAPYQNVDGM